MINSIFSRRSAGVGALAVAILTLPCVLIAAAQTRQGAARVSPSGNYLAARHASVQRDAAAASTYYRAALKADPKNAELLDRAFVSVLAEGNVEEAAALADRVLQKDKNDRIARLVVGIRAFKQKQYGVARQNFAQSVRGPVTDLTAAMLSAWAYFGSGDPRRAVETLDKLSGPDWYGLFKDLHAGLILDASGTESNRKEAAKRLENAHKLDNNALRVVQAYSGVLSRLGETERARAILDVFDKTLPDHPLISTAMQALEAKDPAAPAPKNETKNEAVVTPAPAATLENMLRQGSRGEDVKTVQSRLKIDADGVFGPATRRAVANFQSANGLAADGIVGPLTFAKLVDAGSAAKAVVAEQRGPALPLLVDSAAGGAAEALYGLGAALGRRGGEDLGLVYLQLALYLVPNHPMALLSLADIYEGLKKPQLAIETYEKVPEKSSLRRNADIQMAINLDSVERTAEARQRLEKLVAEHPDDLDAIMALGNILRARKLYDQCADVYGKGIAQIDNPTRGNWLIFYFRGICHERMKRWAAAESDLKKALELYPDQAHVLNYLGYSWVDQGINLDEGMSMIKRAVEQRPDDGYIVDSLGWAHYRLGNYEEATKHLERAIELKPEDPTINDHLGDVYWRTGRTLEAQFQWTHARDLKPEPDELKKIEEKLRSGLAEETATTADRSKKAGNGG